MAYLSWKALHLIAVVAWFAALFYLPRLFVYHALAEAEQDAASAKRFVVMEKRLWILGKIAFTVMLVAGLSMLLAYPAGAAFFKQGWLHVKLLLIVLLFVYYMHCYRLLKRFARGENQHSHRFYRYFNELPTLALIVIVFLAVLKPF